MTDFEPLVLSLQCYCEDNGLKIQTSLKTLVSKNATAWCLIKTSQ